MLHIVTLSKISPRPEPVWNSLDIGGISSASPVLCWKIKIKRIPKMSASATAKHKVETLQEQLRMYQDTLRRQEQGLRELQAHISQTRTVVNITMPGEIDRAHREYINTL